MTCDNGLCAVVLFFHHQAIQRLIVDNSAMRATGTFDVHLKPLSAHEPSVGRLSIDKEFRGDLAATTKGEMLAVRGAVEDSAGYVAMELVTGTLKGRHGTFAFQHSSTMTRGTPKQSITVVADSGTGELAGLSGSMIVIIDGDQHSYEFDYELS